MPSYHSFGGDVQHLVQRKATFQACIISSLAGNSRRQKTKPNRRRRKSIIMLRLLVGFSDGVKVEEPEQELIMEPASAIAPAMQVESDRPELAILFVGVSLVLGLLCRHILRGTRVPYTVALLILGIALGVAEYGTRGTLHDLGQSIQLWSNISPSLILFVFLPALLFESSFAMEVHQIKRCLVQMVLLAGPGVAISTFCTGMLIRYTFPYNWSWSISLLLGGLLSATDPVAVVALLKELGASKKLNTLIEGESLMNDGTAIVIFHLFLELVLGESFSAGTVVVYLSRVALGGVALGAVFGLVSVLWLGLVFNDTVIEITLTLTASYIAYYTAEDEAGVSGVLAVMTVGIFFAVFGRAAFKGETQQSMHYFWEMVAYIANTLIFILSGVVIAEYILKSQNSIEGRDWGYLVLLYVFLQVTRIIVVVTLLPGLQYFGYGLTWKEAIILTWAGLRGAVALALSLSVNALSASDSQDVAILSEKTRARFVFLTGGVVFLTLTINGSTTQFLMHFLKMQCSTDIKLRVVEYTKHEMHLKALEAFEELGEDEELGPAEWQTVTNYLSCLTTSNLPIHAHDLQSTLSGNYENHLQDTRIRLLNGVQAAYWTMVEERRVTQTAALILMQSVDEALDAAMKNEPLADWKGLDPHVQFPAYLKHLWLRNSRIVPRPLLNFLVAGRLESGCYLSAAYLRAHRVARRQLRDFIGESEIAEVVIKESEVEEAAAKEFLEDVRLTFPEVLRAVKTKQVTHAILNHLVDYIDGLEKTGLLENKEINHLHDVVQADLKRLSRNPPLVKMPSTVEILRGHPFIGSQPAEIQEALINSAKEGIKLRNSLLYREDDRAEGIWLVANGVVQWNCKASSGKHLLHPTFSHGSTLGLYEVLTGKSYLCNLRADSVVHCFFLEAPHILSTLRTRPEVEESFWRESLLAVAKILLPEDFERTALQELRVLTMERSIMRIYLKGEVIGIIPGEVGFLLEGFLKQEGTEEILVAPCALTNNPGEAYRGRAEGFSHQDAVYHVETRSRIAVLDLSTLHPLLQRSSTSLMSSAMVLASASSFEHEGLMRWPDSRQQSEMQIRSILSRNPAGSFDPLTAASLSNSSRAMQAIRKVRGSSRSWIESNINKAAFSRRAHRHSQVLPAQRRRYMSTSVLPHPQSETGIISQVRESNNQASINQKEDTSSSSEENDGEEEHIVRIDSPSTLFHQHLSQ
ncbi:hypothetical protein GOP47_0009571 [Adiantum capillus-veneris]|uniref:Cyclic nucleotide-binding domain-containing protein n=1 Tax=Adiantum capillus-veneris TaxID=13818 RepID=A0A9D4UWH1_ADICA|nr:hypothetical protein GOP47_0009571 [Adiantum capillus-veneris]